MTALDDLPFHDPDWPPAPAVEREPRKHVHTYAKDDVTAFKWGVPVGSCRWCEAVYDPTRGRRGKTSRNRGNAFEREGNDLEKIHGWVADSGEGRWTVAEAIDHDVPAPVITLSLLQRFRSRRDPDSYSDRVLAALRNEFGGHAIKDRE